MALQKGAVSNSKMTNQFENRPEFMSIKNPLIMSLSGKFSSKVKGITITSFPVSGWTIVSSHFLTPAFIPLARLFWWPPGGFEYSRWEISTPCCASSFNIDFGYRTSGPSFVSDILSNFFEIFAATFALFISRLLLIYFEIYIYLYIICFNFSIDVGAGCWRRNVLVSSWHYQLWYAGDGFNHFVATILL